MSCPDPAPGSDFATFSADPIVIDDASGSHHSCVLIANTNAERRAGLSNQDDLDGYDGMLFVFEDEAVRSFWMRNTSIPLSIAFYDSAGGFVSAKDMEPCGDSDSCPRYSSEGPARYALEVPRGELPARGATAGSRLTP